MTSSRLQRRNFLKLMGAVPAAQTLPAWAASGEISYLQDASGPAAALPATRARMKLQAALAAHGVKLTVIHDIKLAKGLVVVAAAPGSPLAASFALPAADWASPDCLRLVPGQIDTRP